MIRALILLYALPLLLSAAPEDLLLSPHNKAIFINAQSVFQKSSVALYEGKTFFGYGTLFSENGYVLTKASLLRGREEMSARLDKKAYKPEVISTSREWDVALIKIDIKNGEPVIFSENLPVIGDVIVSNGVTSLLRRRLKFGVISAHSRRIPTHVAALDFFMTFSNEKKRFVVQKMVPEGQAANAGLKQGDVVISLDGEALDDPQLFLLDLFEGKWEGEVAEVVVIRGKKEVTLTIPYSWRHDVYENPQDRNEAMSGRISGRRTGFPMVLQHDIALTQRTVGGPLLDLQGLCLGMNIARYSRAETYAIPAKEMQELYQELRSKKAVD